MADERDAEPGARRHAGAGRGKRGGADDRRGVDRKKLEKKSLDGLQRLRIRNQGPPPPPPPPPKKKSE